MTREQSHRHDSDAPDDLFSIVSILALDVEKLDSMLRSHRPRLEEAGRADAPDPEQVRQQWTRIRASAAQIVNRAQDTLETVRKETSE